MGPNRCPYRPGLTAFSGPRRPGTFEREQDATASTAKANQVEAATAHSGGSGSRTPLVPAAPTARPHSVNDDSTGSALATEPSGSTHTRPVSSGSTGDRHSVRLVIPPTEDPGYRTPRAWTAGFAALSGTLGCPRPPRQAGTTADGGGSRYAGWALAAGPATGEDRPGQALNGKAPPWAGFGAVRSVQ